MGDKFGRGMSKITIPRHIVKKSKTWYQDTVSGKFIHKDGLADYIQRMSQLKIKI